MKTEDNLPIVKDRVLKGHGSGIQCVAISSDGSTLLSGDDDAFLFVWNVKTGEVIQKLAVPFNGAIGATTWIPRDESKLGFAFGCADGSIHIYQERQNSRGPFEFTSMVESPGPIEGLAFHPTTQRLASVGGGCLQVWKVSDAGILEPLIKDPLRKSVVAKSVTFIDDGASVVVFYLESHEISCYTVEPWDLKWTKIVPTRIGNAHICTGDGSFLYVTNLLDGIDQYRFPSLEKVQSLTHPISVNLPMQVSTCARGQWVICGGDSGFARVFNRRTGQILQILEHCDTQPVQVVSTLELEEKSIIITGSSSEGESDLIVWYERVDPPALPGAYAETAKADDTNFMTTAKAIVVYVFLAVFAMQLLIIGTLYLFWPQIRAVMEVWLIKTTPSHETINAVSLKATSVALPLESHAIIPPAHFDNIDIAAQVDKTGYDENQTPFRRSAQGVISFVSSQTIPDHDVTTNSNVPSEVGVKECTASDQFCDEHLETILSSST